MQRLMIVCRQIQAHTAEVNVMKALQGLGQTVARELFAGFLSPSPT